MKTSFLRAALSTAILFSGLLLLTLINLTPFGPSCSAADEGPSSGPNAAAPAVKDDRAEAAERLQSAAVRLFVPGAGGSPVGAQGGGVIIDSGEIVSATHLLLDDEAGCLRDIQHMQIRFLEKPDGEDAMPGGGAINGNVGYDITFIRPARRLPVAGIPVSQTIPKPGDAAVAILLSETRGQNSVTVLKSSVIGTSVDGRFVIISGESIHGDSGCPVVDSHGELIGIVVAGGGQQIGIPCSIWRTRRGYESTWRNTAPTYDGPYIICARPFR
jgi:S1-C subfamily serine protease